MMYSDACVCDVLELINMCVCVCVCVCVYVMF